MAAHPVVAEVAHRPQHLGPLTIELTRARLARNDAGVQVFVADGGAVRRIGPSVAELAAANFEERRGRQHRVPFPFPEQRAVVLPEARIVGEVNGGGRVEQLPIEPVLLNLRAGLVIGDQLVVGRELIGHLAGEVAEVGLVRLHREVRVANRGIKAAHGGIPPHRVALHESADVGVEVAIAVQAIGVFRLQAAAARDAGSYLLFVNVVRLPVGRFIVAVKRPRVAIAARLADEHRVDAWHRTLRAGRSAADRHFLERSVVHVVAE